MTTFWLLLIVSLIVTSTTQSYVEELLEKMSDEDKCGQMTQVSNLLASSTQTLILIQNNPNFKVTFKVIQKDVPPKDENESPIDYNRLLEAIKQKRIGSLLNAPHDVAAKGSTWQQVLELIHDVTFNSTELKIPILFGIDSIHGANYIQEAILFPQPLAMASSWNIDIAKRIGAINAKETRAVGIPWVFNPVFDVGRQWLWSRLYETYGEDVYLSSEMGRVWIEGHQGSVAEYNSGILANSSNEKAATCLKHYVGYSLPFNGNDRTVAWIPDVLLREYFLPPFEVGVRAKSPTVMINSGDVNGIPGHANSYYINDILKGEMGFDGFAVSDWLDIQRLHTRDKVAATPKEAVRMAVMAGVDMSMVPEDYSFYDLCCEIAKDGDDAFRKRIHEATRRILKVKDTVGLFQSKDHILPKKDDLNKINTDEAHHFNLQAARETIVLAKNDKNLLPLKIGDNKKVNHFQATHNFSIYKTKF
jgi:beta-glucosidase